MDINQALDKGYKILKIESPDNYSRYFSGKFRTMNMREIIKYQVGYESDRDILIRLYLGDKDDVLNMDPMSYQAIIEEIYNKSYNISDEDIEQYKNAMIMDSRIDLTVTLMNSFPPTFGEILDMPIDEALIMNIINTVRNKEQEQEGEQKHLGDKYFRADPNSPRIEKFKQERNMR